MNLMKTGYYRSPDDIDNFKIKAMIKEIRSTLPIQSQDQSNSNEFETQTFCWQKKVHSPTEVEFYSNEVNCVTDLEKTYHRNLSKADPTARILFSYIEDDGYAPTDSCIENGTNVGYLCKTLRRLQTNGSEESPVRSNEKGYDFVSSLETNIKTPYIVDECEYMYVMADLGEKLEQMWLKSEHILCTIKYNRKLKTLQIYPDFSANEAQPYEIEIKRDRRCHYHYYILNACEEIPKEIYSNEFEILSKVNQQKTDVMDNFEMGPKHLLQVYVFVEILQGSFFENDNLFVHYFLDLPDTRWTCDKEVHGFTHTVRTKSWKKLAHYSYPFEMTLSYNTNGLDEVHSPSNPILYFEVASRDSWDRFRTEGLTYKCVPVESPGIKTFDLQCIRVLPKNVSGNLRRFFIGDYHGLGDPTWIGIPSDFNETTINKYGVETVGTGTLSVRMNVVQQCSAFLQRNRNGNVADGQEKFIWEKLNAATLVKSVHQVLQAFKRARKNIKEVRQQL